GMLASPDALLRFMFGPITVSRSWNASSGVIRFWNRFIAPEKSESTQRVTMPVGPTDAFERRREMLCNRIFYAPAFWGAFVLLGLLQVVAVARMEIESPSDAPLIAAIESPEGFQRELFAGFRSDWELMDFRTEERDERSFWGRYSRVWEFDTPYGFAMISLDFPFHGYHPLDDCYRNTGWQLSPVGVFTPPMEEGVPEGPVYQFDMTKSDGQIGYVNFSVFDRDGELTRRGTDDLRPRLRERFQHSPVMWLAGVKPKSIDASSYQLQLFVSAPRQLTEAERQELRNHYVDALAHVLKHWEQHIVAKPSGE